MDPVSAILLAALLTWAGVASYRWAEKRFPGKSPSTEKTAPKTGGSSKSGGSGTARGSGSGTTPGGGSKTDPRTAPVPKQKRPEKTTRPVSKTGSETTHDTGSGTTSKTTRGPLINVTKTTTTNTTQTANVNHPPKTGPGTTGTTSTGGAMAGSINATENVEAHMNAADELAKKAQDFADQFQSDIVTDHETVSNDAESLGLDAVTGDWVDTTNMWARIVDEIKQAAEKTATTARDERTRYQPSVEAVGAAGYRDTTTAGQIRPQ